MINILTLHFGTNAWLEIQKRHILKYTDGKDYKLWLGKFHTELPEDFELPDNWEIIDLDESYPEDLASEHYFQMEWMFANRVKDNMEDDDIIVFMDNDAFPVHDKWLTVVKNNLNGSLEWEGGAFPEAMSVVMPENRGIAQPDEYYPYADLCFFATKKRTWDEKLLQWTLVSPLHIVAAGESISRGELFKTQEMVIIDGVECVVHQNPGFGMHDRLRYANLGCATIQRTNKFNAHNVMFGVYGDIIYHQQCGSRALIGRPLKYGNLEANNSRQCYTGQDLYGRRGLGADAMLRFEEECEDIIDTNTQIFDIIYSKLEKDEDCTFIKRYFMGIK